MSERYNRLIEEQSPYLLQHAHNPVDWYPWGEEALSRARSEEKPIFLSIGYSACHWCHVMERESFENEAVAKLMNEHFVCVKVDPGFQLPLLHAQILSEDGCRREDAQGDGEVGETNHGKDPREGEP